MAAAMVLTSLEESGIRARNLDPETAIVLRIRGEMNLYAPDCWRRTG
jgi:hypothetical protein